MIWTFAIYLMLCPNGTGTLDWQIVKTVKMTKQECELLKSNRPPTELPITQVRCLSGDDLTR